VVVVGTSESGGWILQGDLPPAPTTWAAPSYPHHPSYHCSYHCYRTRAVFLMLLLITLHVPLRHHPPIDVFRVADVIELIWVV
jgi:hypothetical protein